ncbi:MAG: hypothetical protein R3F59_16980 [Myxococcota bacterium]
MAWRLAVSRLGAAGARGALGGLGGGHGRALLLLLRHGLGLARGLLRPLRLPLHGLLEQRDPLAQLGLLRIARAAGAFGGGARGPGRGLDLLRGDRRLGAGALGDAAAPDGFPPPRRRAHQRREPLRRLQRDPPRLHRRRTGEVFADRTLRLEQPRALLPDPCRRVVDPARLLEGGLGGARLGGGAGALQARLAQRIRRGVAQALQLAADLGQGGAHEIEALADLPAQPLAVGLELEDALQHLPTLGALEVQQLLEAALRQHHRPHEVFGAEPHHLHHGLVGVALLLGQHRAHAGRLEPHQPGGRPLRDPVDLPVGALDLVDLLRPCALDREPEPDLAAVGGRVDQAAPRPGGGAVDQAEQREGHRVEQGALAAADAAEDAEQAVAAELFEVDGDGLPVGVEPGDAQLQRSHQPAARSPASGSVSDRSSRVSSGAGSLPVCSR